MITVNPTTVGILLGSLACVYHALRPMRAGENKKDMSEAANLLLGFVGIPAGLQCLYLSLTATPEELGVFKDQTLAISLGGIAMIWVSVKQINEIIPISRRGRAND